MATPRSLRTLSLGLIAAALLAVAPAGLAHAAPKPSLADVERQVNALNAEVDVLANQYDAGRIALAAASRRATVAQARVRAAQRQFDGVRRSMSAVAAAAYRAGTADQFVQLVSTSTPQTFLDRAASLDRIAAGQSAQLAAAATARHRLAAASSDAAAEQAAQQAAAASLAAAKQQIESALAQEQQLLAGLRADQRRRFEAARQAEVAAATQRASRDRVAVASWTYNGPASGRAAIAVREAYAQLGKPYQWGASGPDSFDCSGLTMWAWGKAGVSLPHYTGDQWNAGRHVSQSELRPGDLVFFGQDLGHMGMYIGNGQFIHAPHTGTVVQIASLSGYYQQNYAGAVRVGG